MNIEKLKKAIKEFSKNSKNNSALCPPSKNGHKKASKNEMNRSISLIY